jgi:CyaY protein
MTSEPADHDFLRQADACLGRLVKALDAFAPDELEADLSGGVLRISFPDGRNCIVNRQSAAQQIWVAEGASAWHFVRGVDGDWQDTKGRGGLSAILSEVLSRRLGRPVRV